MNQQPVLKHSQPINARLSTIAGSLVGDLTPPDYFNFAADVVDHWARHRPSGPALWHVRAPSGGETRLTFAEVSIASRKAAGLFLSAGIRPGDKVLLMLPRIPQWWICMLALIRIGAVPVPATLLLTTRDVHYRIEQARVSAVITSQDGISKLDGFTGRRILVEANAPGWIPFDEAVHQADEASPPPTRSNAPGVIYFTSATTGDPKMVLHTQASYGMGHRLTGALWLDLRPTDVHWNISDLGWGKAAWSSFFGPWQMGACVFVLDGPGKFDAALTLKVLENFPITTWCAPPTALRQIVRQNLSRHRFPSLRHCVTAGEPLNPEVFKLWMDATGHALHEGYGQSETVVMICNSRCFQLPIKPGSMGIPVPGMDVRLLDHGLHETPPGVEGEIALRVNPSRPVGLFREYLGSPEETASCFSGDYYLTGDRAIRDDDGYFWFVGRKDDVIKSSGYRIGPFEVESALIEHPAVLDAAVVGKPDPLRSQIVKAYIILRPGFCPTEELRAELQSHCKRLIAAYKYPREIEFVHDLPKTTSGKTKRIALRHPLWKAGD